MSCRCRESRLLWLIFIQVTGRMLRRRLVFFICPSHGYCSGSDHSIFSVKLTRVVTEFFSRDSLADPLIFPSAFLLSYEFRAFQLFIFFSFFLYVSQRSIDRRRDTRIFAFEKRSFSTHTKSFHVTFVFELVQGHTLGQIIWVSCAVHPSGESVHVSFKTLGLRDPWKL